MPDREGNTGADKDALPDTPLHAYKEGRKDDVSGDADKLESDDPQDHQVSEVEGEDELGLAAEKK